MSRKNTVISNIIGTNWHIFNITETWFSTNLVANLESYIIHHPVATEIPTQP
jgi:hypothetical protein